MAEEPQKQEEASRPKGPSKGVVLGKDGKPCRSCTSFRDWAAMTKKKTPSSSSSHSSPSSLFLAAVGAVTAAASAADGPPQDCPPDVEVLGRSTWTFLHTMTAAYPPKATPTQQSEMRMFLSLFAKFYPCWSCAEDFQAWMKDKGNEPRVRGRGELGMWMCEAHNEVNRKLGKKEFDCRKWEERWRTGWADGGCD